jgi:hypothetical protein
VYLDYDGNRGTLTPNDRMELLQYKVCPHHPVEETGDPLFDIREYCDRVAERESARLVAVTISTKTTWWQRNWYRLFGPP